MQERITIVVDIDREYEPVYQSGFNPIVMVLKGIGVIGGLAFYAAWLLLDAICKLLAASVRAVSCLMHRAWVGLPKRHKQAQPLRVISVVDSPIALIAEKPEEITGVWRVQEKVHV